MGLLTLEKNAIIALKIEPAKADLSYFKMLGKA
jgi:hypothetical protein